MASTNMEALGSARGFLEAPSQHSNRQSSLARLPGADNNRRESTTIGLNVNRCSNTPESSRIHPISSCSRLARLALSTLSRRL